MNNQNDAWMVQFIIYGTALFAVVMVIAIAGAFLAAGAVVIFCVTEWYKIVRYEGYQPIMWLAGITAVAALIGISGAADQLEIASQLQARNRPSGGHVVGAFLYIVAIAAPTAGYWAYRLARMPAASPRRLRSRLITLPLSDRPQPIIPPRRSITAPTRTRHSTFHNSGQMDEPPNQCPWRGMGGVSGHRGHGT